MHLSQIPQQESVPNELDALKLKIESIEEERIKEFNALK